MFFALAFVCAGDPTFVVENKCPAFVVTNKCPAAKAKPGVVANGFNCRAGFCGANGGAGCPSCPNGAGTCACGPAGQVKAAKEPAVAARPGITYTLGVQSCPSGNCPRR